MHHSVERFAINVRDPIADARASVGQAPAGARGIGWLLLPLAIAVGVAVGWLGHVRPSPPVFDPTPPAIEPGHGGAGSDGWLARLLPGTAPAPVGHRGAVQWPVMLHRAGDGAFYADLAIGNRVASLRVDPGAPESRLPRALLPADALITDGIWPAQGVTLGHLRLDGHRFTIGETSADAVLGNDLLGAAGSGRRLLAEESADRLRLALPGR